MESAAGAAPATVKPARKARRKARRATRPAAGASAPATAKSGPTHAVVRVELQLRHFEWLQAVGKSENRNPGQMAERLIRMAYANDPMKGGTAGGSTVLGSGSSSGNGVSGRHPASGGNG